MCRCIRGKQHAFLCRSHLFFAEQPSDNMEQFCVKYNKIELFFKLLNPVVSDHLVCWRDSKIFLKNLSAEGVSAILCGSVGFTLLYFTAIIFRSLFSLKSKGHAAADLYGVHILYRLHADPSSPSNLFLFPLEHYVIGCLSRMTHNINIQF